MIKKHLTFISMQHSNKEKLGREIIALMLKLAKKDQYYDEKEFVYILQVSNYMGISSEEMRDIQLNLNKYNFTPPKTESERMTVLYYLLFCMKSDGKVTDEEVRLVQKIGFRLGFREQLTEDLIQSVKMHADKKLPPEQLLDNLRKYLN